MTYPKLKILSFVREALPWGQCETCGTMFRAGREPGPCAGNATVAIYAAFAIHRCLPAQPLRPHREDAGVAPSSRPASQPAQLPGGAVK